MKDSGNNTKDDTVRKSVKNENFDVDELSVRLRNEALKVQREEPDLSILLETTVLAPGVVTFEDAVAYTMAYRLLGDASPSSSTSCETPLSLVSLRQVFQYAFASTDKELGHTMKEAVRQDASAVMNRDPACQTLLEVILFFKGFAALVCHRAARRKYEAGNRMVALLLQSLTSAKFGVDLHPAATIGKGVMLDHGTGIVIGETAVVGDGCTLLHGVTLGGTGKESGDRHPKIGSHVLVGTSVSILGNIQVGDNAKIGAGSIVLRPIPSGATAVGVPAKIIGRVQESDPGSAYDTALDAVTRFQLPPKETKGADYERTSSATSEVTLESEIGEGDDHFEDFMDPYRDLRRLGRRAPRGSVTCSKLRKILEPEGVTPDEAGEIFFSMDKDMVGHVTLEEFENEGAKYMRRHSQMEPKRCERVVNDHVGKSRMRRVLELGSSLKKKVSNSAKSLARSVSSGSEVNQK